MDNFLNHLHSLLKTNPNLQSTEGELLKNKTSDLAMQLDQTLLATLLNDEQMREHFFTEVNGIQVFDKIKFCWVINSKEFLPNSYTRYKNHIGLVDEWDNQLAASNEINLSWAYKDCILAGGQSKEEKERQEVFYNQTLATEEIDRLLEPKVMTNATLYSSNQTEPVEELSNSSNLLIKGNNLLALYSLLPRYKGKVKCIYIDPPYYFSDNKDNDSFTYNSNFKLSTWLVFMKNRLEVASKLLAENGTIFMQINDEGQAYLKIICDEIFGKDNFINTIAVKMKNIAGASGGGQDKKLKKNLEFIHVYAKNYQEFNGFKNIYDYIELSELLAEYKKNKSSWKYTSVLLNPGTKQLVTTTVDGDGNEIKIFTRDGFEFASINQLAKAENVSEIEIYHRYQEKIFTTAMPQSSIRGRVLQALSEKNITNELISIEYTPKTGKNKGTTYEQFYKGDSLRLITWLKDVTVFQGDKLFKKERQGTLWSGLNLNNLTKEGQVVFANGKKPEALLSRILEMSTDEGDLILDFFAGSGTTCTVAHKLQRQYIGIEQMDYIADITLKRLQNVIKGEQGGISPTINWQGGGSVIYCELHQQNEKYMEQIAKCQSTNELLAIYTEILNTGFINYYVDVANINKYQTEFTNLKLTEQKQLLFELLDKNLLYTNYCDIADQTFAISDEDKAFNHSFYKGDKS